ncbi:MAG: hypothetical protein Q9204_000523 [Flavoplaca sp. TL-2023a]
MSVHQGFTPAFGEIEKLVLQLYQPASPYEVSQTERSLQELQRANSGWHMADALLASEDTSVRFFGALTFTVKINCDWESLQEGEVAQLLHRLLTWLTFRIKSNEGPLVIKKLCTALVAYFLRSSASYKYHDRVHSNLADFVQLIQTVMTLPKHESTTVLVEESIKCLQAWVIFGHGAWQDKSGQQEMAPLLALIPYTAPLLYDLEFFEVTADCWAEILGAFGQFFPPQSMDYLEAFLISQNAQDLLSFIVHGEYETDALAYSRLLLMYGEVKLSDLARQASTTFGMVLIESLMQLLAYEGYAGVNDDICTPAMEFWQAYTEFLVDEIGTTDDQMEPWMGSARDYLLQVLERCWIKIRMPPEDVYAQWTPEAKGDFKVFRTDVVDLLQSSYALLGASIFVKFADLALDALQKQEWLQLEATLFCLNALAESISDDIVADATLSTLFSSELFAAMTNGAIDIPSKTQQTAVNLIISFSSFFERHTQYLLSMLSFLFIAIRTPAIAAVAAKAILSTADSCRKTLVSEIDAFLDHLDNVLISEDLESGSQERVFGAIAAVIQAIPSEEQKIWSLSKLLAFVGREVDQCMEFAEYQAPVGAEERGMRALRCLINIGKYMQEPDDSPIDLEAKTVSQNDLYLPTIWTPSQRRMVEYMHKVQTALGNDNGDVVEAICQVFRTGFREKFPGPFVFSPSFIEDYVAGTSPQSLRIENILDMAGAMISAHTRAGTTRLDTSATRFLEHQFRLIAEIQCKSFST